MRSVPCCGEALAPGPALQRERAQAVGADRGPPSQRGSEAGGERGLALPRVSWGTLGEHPGGAPEVPARSWPGVPCRDCPLP